MMLAHNKPGIRSPRSGMSMAEVLVALFLMALGTLAILTLFPLGFLHMGQALKDDRTAQCAQQADAFMRMYWRQNVVENPFAPLTGATGFPGYEPMTVAMDFPDAKPDLNVAAPVPNPVKGLPVVTSGPSYPVFVDPFGWYAPWASSNTAAHQYWVGNHVYARRSLNLMLREPNNAFAQSRCSLMDGFGFDESGAPSSSNGAFIDRELRYNWLWVLQRPDNSIRNTANMTIVTFDKRSFQFANQNAEMVFTSGATGPTTIVMQPLLTTVSIPVTQGVPPVRKGGWILDATPALRHAIFYRVASITDNSTTTGTTDLELQTPIRRLDGSTAAYPGTLIYLDGVSEVFTRPNLTATDY